MNITQILSNVGFDWRLAVLNLLNFFIIFLLLKKFLFSSVTNALQKRKEFIAQGVENARKAKTELTMAERRAQELLDDAKGQANSIIEAAHVSAAQQADILKQKSKQEIELLVSQAKEQIAAQKAEMKEELRSETIDLVITVVQKLLGDTLDTKKQEAHIKEIVGSLKK